MSLTAKTACIQFLIDKGFLAYNYDTEKLEEASLLLTNEYMEYGRNSLRYFNEDFVFSSSINKKFMGYTIDGVIENARIVLEFSNEIGKIVDNFKYAFIDNAGDSPNGLEKWLKI